MGGIKHHRGYDIRLHDDAISDLADIEAASPRLAARLRVFLQEYLEDDPDARLNLSVEDFRNGIMQVDKWSAMCQIGYEIWRIKLHGDLPPMGQSEHGSQHLPYLHHRIPYAFDDTNEVIWLLGIFERGHEEDDYDPESDFGQRIRSAYSALGLPVHH